MAEHLRLYFGDISPRDGESIADVLDVIRQAYREDRIGWYVVESFDGPADVHPRADSAQWTEMEGAE